MKDLNVILSTTQNVTFPVLPSDVIDPSDCSSFPGTLPTVGTARVFRANRQHDLGGLDRYRGRPHVLLPRGCATKSAGRLEAA